ncbi:hypothetical protein HGM15179_007450 [Zosterops borbonicus]|uniref:Uncharacterized protein n=1 Tax=Zosterops borbonicus TaxID=364589 RepID=A0A8K1GIP7_9PASS|nr:hypothetical protein HGM15179_007450 [Zosterops borbonicus]
MESLAVSAFLRPFVKLGQVLPDELTMDLRSLLGRLFTGGKWFGSSSLGGASPNGMMKCVMSPVSFNGPLTEDIPMGVVEE